MVAPVIPGLNDQKIEAILTEAAQAGAGSAIHILLRLPYEDCRQFRPPPKAGDQLALL